MGDQKAEMQSCLPRRWSRLAFRAEDGVQRPLRMKTPALSLQKAERQGQGTLGNKIKKKGWVSPQHQTASLLYFCKYDRTPPAPGNMTKSRSPSELKSPGTMTSS